MKKLFTDWKPKAGELAVVPGGPANAQYLDRLEKDDIKAIENGHRGYKPRVIYFVATDQPERISMMDVAIFWESDGKWHSEKGSVAQRLCSVLKTVRRNNIGNIIMRATDPMREH